MARTSNASSKPSSLRRIINLALLAFPAPLLIVSFGLTLATIYSSRFAIADLYVPTADGTSTQLSPQHTRSRSPFYTCTLLGSEAAGTLKELCHRWNHPSASCSPLSAPDNPHLCQQVTLSGNLLIAAAVFLGLAMVMSFAVVALAFPAYSAGSIDDVSYIPLAAAASDEHHRSKRHHHQYQEEQQQEQHQQEQGGRQRTKKPLASFLTIPTLLFILISIVLLLLAQLLGVNALVNDQPPNGDWASSTTPAPPDATSNLDSTTGPWKMGKASLIWLTTAWVSAGSAVLVAQIGWVLPRMGVV